MTAVLLLAGVPEGIPVVADDAAVKTLCALMRPSRKQHTWTGSTVGGDTITIACDMLTAVIVRADQPKARKR
jgi:hypothetical protein